MNEAVPTYRVSRLYIWNLWQQALVGGLGILASWALFLIVSFLLRPGLPFEQLWQLPARVLTDPNLWMMPTPDEIRELIRFGVGPGFAFCALLGGLTDTTSWVAVCYEIHPDKLRMRWRRFTRDISWDLIQSVDERPHADTTRRSLRITQYGTGPILVRGLDALPDFIDVLRSRLPHQAKWRVAPCRIDLTSCATNFTIGFLLLLPLSLTWIAYYVFDSKSIELFWSLALLVIAVWIWFQRPLSRPHMCVREVEVLMALVIVLLSGVLTFIGWMESSNDLPLVFSRLFGW